MLIHPCVHTYIFKSDSNRNIYKNCRGVGIQEPMIYTLSHPENDRDVSARSRQRRLSSLAQLVCVFSRVQKGTPGLTHKGCVLHRVSLGALSDVTVVLGMRQSIDFSYAKIMKMYSRLSVMWSIFCDVI